MTLPASFWAKTRPATDCILWTGAVNNKGYGCFAVRRRSQLAHRLAWEAARGPIPEGMTLDHLCRVRNCVNVDHLEIVTIGENTRRARALVIGDECGHGHPIRSDMDLYHRTDGGAECRECRRDAARRAKARRSAASELRSTG